jgi:hypothetical protein
MLQAYVFHILPYFRCMLQHLLLPTRSDSWACTCCTHLAIVVYLCHASPNSQTCTQWTVSAQMAEHSLVKAHAERQRGPAPNRCKNRRPCTTRRGPQCSMQPCQHGYVHCAPILSFACSWADPTHMLSRAGAVAGAGCEACEQARGAKHVGRRCITRVFGRPALAWPVCNS